MKHKTNFYKEISRVLNTHCWLSWQDKGVPFLKKSKLFHSSKPPACLRNFLWDERPTWNCSISSLQGEIEDISSFFICVCVFYFFFLYGFWVGNCELGCQKQQIFFGWLLVAAFIASSTNLSWIALLSGECFHAYSIELDNEVPYLHQQCHWQHNGDLVYILCYKKYINSCAMHPCYFCWKAIVSKAMQKLFSNVPHFIVRFHKTLTNDFLQNGY